MDAVSFDEQIPTCLLASLGYDASSSGSTHRTLVAVVLQVDRYELSSAIS